MIKNLYGNSQWIHMEQYGTVMPYINTTQPMAGMLRLNSNMNRIEVYDGQTWHGVGGDAQVDLSENAKEILTWAREKMEEDRRLKHLMTKHLGLKDLHDKFEMMRVLCQEEEKHK